jgi:crotonobetainyl-CoA:carnitine CoA-transferase CaiB-like acyl-CoA transferase
MASEQARTNGYVVEMEHPVAGKISVTGCPVTLNDDVSHDSAPPPEHGQNTEEVLLDLGYTWEQIAELREHEVI